MKKNILSVENFFSIAAHLFQKQNSPIRPMGHIRPMRIHQMRYSFPCPDRNADPAEWWSAAHSEK